jgi:hypothetical protein
MKIMIYRTIILSVVLYGCETWSLSSEEERRLRVFGNWVQSRVFGPKRGEVIGEWRKLHNEELIDLYSQNIIWVKNEMGGAYSTYEERRGAYRFLVGNPEGNRPLGRFRRRWKGNVKMNLQEVA